MPRQTPVGTVARVPAAFLARSSPVRWGSAVAALALAASAGAQAQAPRVVVSTTSDVASLGLEDGHLVAAGGGGVPEPWFLDGHWRGTFGVVPSDVDAFAFREGFTPATAESIAFSLLSDQKGFADGDVLVLGKNGGVEVLVSEDEIAQALGVPGVPLDIDALDFDATGALLFSLQSDLASSVLGPVQDGDVLRLDAAGVASVVYTESDVDFFLQVATGSSATAGDVQGFDLVASEPWFLVQSPSGYDGAVLVGGANSRIVLEEADIGLGGAELNALTYLPREYELPRVVLTPDAALPTDPLHIAVDGNPGGMALVLVSGTSGHVPWARLPGFGAFLLDPNDPLFQFLLTQSFPFVSLDGQGHFEADFVLIQQALSGLGFCGEAGWTFQVVDFPSRRISAPFRVEAL